jgi:hypothetical protein
VERQLGVLAKAAHLHTAPVQNHNTNALGRHHRTLRFESHSFWKHCKQTSCPGNFRGRRARTALELRPWR